MPQFDNTPAQPVPHPVAAGVALVATGALVVAVVTGLAKGSTSRMERWGQ